MLPPPQKERIQIIAMIKKAVNVQEIQNPSNQTVAKSSS